MVRRIKSITQVGATNDQAVAWVSSETVNGGIDSKAFGPIPVQSILARACYYYNDKYVFLPYQSLLICRTKALSRIMSNRFPLTRCTFRMESIFSNNDYLILRASSFSSLFVLLQYRWLSVIIALLCCNKLLKKMHIIFYSPSSSFSPVRVSV